MKKIISVLAALSISMGCAVSAADFNNTESLIIAQEPTPLTPAGGIMTEEGTVSEADYYPLMLMTASDDEQTLEEYLREQLVNHETTINVSRFKIPLDEFSRKYFAFIFCNSDLPIRAAYNNGTYFIENGTKYMNSINPVYIYSTKAECDSKYAELDALTTSLAGHADKGRTELEKALLLFDKISLDYYYTPGDTYETINYTPYSFLDNGHGVCQGYAILYKLTLEKLNIESYLCANHEEDVNHAWNYIKINNKWYHADPTWSYYADADGMVSHKYFLLSDEAAAADGKHGTKDEWEAQQSSLASIDCTSTEYESGYLFRDFPGCTIYRDNASLYFNYEALTTDDETLTLTLRNDTLKSPAAMLSEPGSFDGQTQICMLTIKEISTKSHVIVSGYTDSGKYTDCTKLTASSLPASSLIKLPTFGLESKSDKLKWMLLDAATLSPLTYYSELKVNEEQ